MWYILNEAAKCKDHSKESSSDEIDHAKLLLESAEIQCVDGSMANTKDS